MSAQVFVPLFLAVVLAVYVGTAVRTWRRLRGPLVVICPQTTRRAAVAVDLGHAMTTALREEAHLRLTSCSQWPGLQNCDQMCVDQIEAWPAETCPKVMVREFFTGAPCALCRGRIERPGAAALPPGFMRPASRQVHAWVDLPPEQLPEAIALWRPLCGICTFAERDAAVMLNVPPWMANVDVPAGGVADKITAGDPTKNHDEKRKR